MDTYLENKNMIDGQVKPLSNIEPSILLRVPKKKNAIWVRTFDIGRINFSKL